MKHIVISDTHSPQCIEKAYRFLKKRPELLADVDAIVINGDLLGVFSMKDSVLHKGKWIKKEKLQEYLKAAAPNFYSRFKSAGAVTPDMLNDYVQERYNWVVEILANFAKLKRTIFNLGNHESEHHLLVLQEIPFLTESDPSVISRVDRSEMKSIVSRFEKDLYNLERSLDFKYIRHTHIIEKGVMILGIPGESHATEGNDPESIKQENKTKELIEHAMKDLPKVSSIVIYNHTQGKYDKSTGKFWSASPSLSRFMHNLPSNVIRRIFVQSHNHWSYSQFQMHNTFNILMNNAGLHGGIFNMIEFDIFKVACHDVDPNSGQIFSVKRSSEHKPYRSDEELISRYYDDVPAIMQRKTSIASSCN